MIHRAGFSLVELLIVLAMLSLVGAWQVWRPVDGVAMDARSLARAVTVARARAAVSGRAVAVFGSTCGPAWGGPVGWFAERAAISEPPRGLLFTPEGLPRTCDGGGVGNTTILLEYRGQQAAVIVSSLGRVRWEMR